MLTSNERVQQGGQNTQWKPTCPGKKIIKHVLKTLDTCAHGNVCRIAERVGPHSLV